MQRKIGNDLHEANAAAVRAALDGEDLKRFLLGADRASGAFILAPPIGALAMADDD